MAEAGGAGPGNNEATRKIRFSASMERPFDFMNEPVRARTRNRNSYVNTAQEGREYRVDWRALPEHLLQHVVTGREAALLSQGKPLEEVLPPTISSARLGGHGLRGLVPIYPSFLINSKTNRRARLAGPNFQQTNEEKRLTKANRSNRRPGYAYTRENQMENLRIAQAIHAAKSEGERRELVELLEKRRKGTAVRARETAAVNRAVAEAILAEPDVDLNAAGAAGGAGGGGGGSGIAMMGPGRIRPRAAGTVRQQPLVVPPPSLLTAPQRSALKGTRKALTNKAAANKAAANKAAAAAAAEEEKKRLAVPEPTARRQLAPLPLAAQAKARPTLGTLPGMGVTARAVITETAPDSLSTLLGAGGGGGPLRRAGLLPPMGAPAATPAGFLSAPAGQPVARLPYAPSVGAAAAGALAPLRSTLGSAGASLFKPGKPMGGGKRRKTRKLTKRRRAHRQRRKN